MIYFIIGKSASGKDTLIKNVVKKNLLEPIISYTTRPMREGEIDGIEYYFVNDSFIKEHEKDIIEKRTYHTVVGIWTYFTCRFEDSDEKNYVAYGPLAMCKKFQEFFPKMKTIYLNTSSKERLLRSLGREINPDCKEICRRFLEDEKDYENVKSIENLIVLDGNKSQEEILKELEQIIN